MNYFVVMDDSELEMLVKDEPNEQASEGEMEEVDKPEEESPEKKQYSLIQELLRDPFLDRGVQEQIDIIKKGRPCPDLGELKCLHRERSVQYTRTFNNAQYEVCDWLAGCEVQNKLYCWPCLLFNRTPSIWNHGGFTNLNNVHSSQRKHKVSVSHLQSILVLAKYEVDIGRRASETVATPNTSVISNFDHNVIVRKNLDVLKKMIDVMFMFLTRDIPFKNDVNGRMFETILGYLLKDEPNLETRLKNSDTFRDLTTIRNDILHAMTEVAIDEIVREIEKSPFVALMFDELHDANLVPRLSTIIRYVYEDNVFERFLGFTDMSEGRTADRMLAHIAELVKRFKLSNKIIAQTYNGASSSGFDFEELQNKLLVNHGNAHVVNCYAHVLNDVISGSLSHIKECEIFFNTLNRMVSFKVHVGGTTETLVEFLETKLPSLSEGRWNFTSCWVYHVNVHRNEILEFFQRVVETDERVDGKERMFAMGCLKFLNQFRTMFLLNLFSTIFNSSHKLFEMTQNESFDFVVCKQKAEKFLSDLKNLRENGFKILWDFVNERFQPKQKTKRICYGLYTGNVEQEKCKELFDEVTNIVNNQTQMRFGEFDKFLFFDLLNSKRQKPFTGRTKIPEELIKSMNETYPGLFDAFQMKNELSVLYNNTDFGDVKGIHALDKMKWLSEKLLAPCFDGVYKLAALVLTIPISCDPINSSDSCLNKVERYFQNSESVDRLDDRHSLLVMEKNLLYELKTTRSFYDKVVAKFISIKKDTNFQFKAGTFYSF